MSKNGLSDDRLDSWKEIAAYLGWDKRTVIRWEKTRGLPVHRVPGGQRNAVFAYQQELDDWLQRSDDSDGVSVSIRGAVPQADTDLTLPDVDLPLSETPLRLLNQKTKFSPSGFIRSRKWKLLALAACTLSLVAAISVNLLAFLKPATIRIANLQKLTDDGHVKINLRSSGSALYFNEFEASRETLAAAPINGGPIQAINTPFANVDLQDASKDGQSLLVTSFDGMETGGRPLWVISAKGGMPTRIGDVLCDVARWSPDGRKIACVTGTLILVLNGDGSGVHTVGSFSALPRQLLWSSDGTRLRFVVRDLTVGTLTPWELVMREGESTAAAPARLPLGKKCCWQWMWTRDGKSFLYNKSDDDGHGRFFIQPQQSWFAQETELPIQSLALDTGDFAPGRANGQLYILVGNGYRGQLLKFDSRSKGFQATLHGLSADCLSFSRDGQWMTYVTPPDNSLWRSRVDGTEAIQLTKLPIETEFSAWSPDGQQIAFMMKRPEKPWRIFLADRDGRNLKEAGHGNDGQGAPTWSADGTALVYGNVACEETHSCWVRHIDLATGREEVLPGSNGFTTARWSPDGKYIVALQPQMHELMLFDVKTRHWRMLADSITGSNPNWSNDSQFVYMDTQQGKTLSIVRLRIRDGHRETVADLTPFQKSPGQLDYWIGLTPDNSPMVFHQTTGVEVYALEWTER